jgi:hypothetical protein
MDTDSRVVIPLILITGRKSNHGCALGKVSEAEDQKAETTQETGPWSKFQKAKADPDRSFEVPTAQNLATDRARPVQPPEPRGVASRAKEALAIFFLWLEPLGCQPEQKRQSF